MVAFLKEANENPQLLDEKGIYRVVELREDGTGLVKKPKGTDKAKEISTQPNGLIPPTGGNHRNQTADMPVTTTRNFRIPRGTAMGISELYKNSYFQINARTTGEAPREFISCNSSPSCRNRKKSFWSNTTGQGPRNKA